MWDQTCEGAITQSVSEHVRVARVGEGGSVCLVEHVGGFFVDGAACAEELWCERVGLVFYGPVDGLRTGEEMGVDL